MTLRRALKRLRLKPGDAVIVRSEYDYNLSLRVAETGRTLNLTFGVPILEVYGKRSLKTIPFKQLEQAYLSAKIAKEKKDADNQ